MSSEIISPAETGTLQMQPTKEPGKWAQLWIDIKKNKVSYYFLAPFLLLFTIFTIVPIIMSVVLSFTYYNIIETPTFIGFSNYKLLFVDDDIFMKAVMITLKFSIINPFHICKDIHLRLFLLAEPI